MIRRISRSLNARLVLSFLLVASIAVGLLGYTAYNIGTVLIQDSIFRQLNVATNLKEEELNRWIDDQRKEVQVLAALPIIRDNATSMIDNLQSSQTYSEAHELLNNYLLPIVYNEATLIEVFILSNSGGEILYSTTPRHEGMFRVSDDYFTSGKQGITVQNVYPSPITLRPTITIAAPIFSRDQRQVGVIAAHLNLDRLDQIVAEQSNADLDSETYLVSRFNTFISSQRFGRSEFPQGIHSIGIDRALASQDGSDLYPNYRGENVVGVYRWVDSREIALISEVPQAQALATVRTLATYIIGIGFAMETIMLIMIYILTRAIIRPVLDLREAAAQVALGNFNVQTRVQSHDEIGELTATFNRMTEQIRTNREVLEEQVAQRTSELREKNTYLEQGLILAHDIQANLLPSRAPWNDDLLVAYARSVPSAEIGGDFYTYVEINHQRVGSLVGDISGKGVAAALMMTLTSGLLEERAKEGGRASAVLASVSDVLIKRLQANRMNAAVMYLVYDQLTSMVQIANAGMIAPFLIRDGTISLVDAVGLPLGSINAVSYRDVEFRVKSGDVLAIISDGVVEAHNNDREMFGFERVQQLLLASSQLQDNRDPVTFILERLYEFSGTTKPHDDMTIVWLRVP